MTDSEKNGPVPREPEPGPENLPRTRSGGEEQPASQRRAISDAMMQALEDDMDRRPGVYRRLATS